MTQILGWEIEKLGARRAASVSLRSNTTREEGGTNWKESSLALDEFSGNLICLSLSCACCESSFHPAAIRSYANGGHF